MTGGRYNSADALPFDIIPLFFHWLTNYADLASTALVSRTWHQAATMRLYSAILYTAEMARQNGRISSPFDVLLAHKDYALHVKHLTIQSVPTSNNKPNDAFAINVARCLDLCRNLTSFSCMSHGILPSLISRIATGKPRLADLKLEAVLNRPESQLLLGVKTLKRLSLDSPTRVVLHFLPNLVENNAANLESLSITNSFDLDHEYLGTILSHVPELKSLKISDCIYITHVQLLRVVAQCCPALTSLSFMIYTPFQQTDPQWPTFLALKHLSINVRQCDKDAVRGTLGAVLTATNQAALESFTLRLAERANLPSPLLEDLIKHQKGTLKKFNIVNTDVTGGQLERICAELSELQQLSFIMSLGVVCAVIVPAFLSANERYSEDDDQDDE
ncbi:hypothetical protein FRB90_002715 [Tulasnella sp. 427]|nr:hypothetical protein FRB90_002715 [Tulasnella sp. 427]